MSGGLRAGVAGQNALYRAAVTHMPVKWVRATKLPRYSVGPPIVIRGGIVSCAVASHLRDRI